MLRQSIDELDWEGEMEQAIAWAVDNGHATVKEDQIVFTKKGFSVWYAAEMKRRTRENRLEVAAWLYGRAAQIKSMAHRSITLMSRERRFAVGAEVQELAKRTEKWGRDGGRIV